MNIIKERCYELFYNIVRLFQHPPNPLEKGISATVFTQNVTSSVQDKIATVDLIALSDREPCQVRSLLQKYSGVFSAHQVDIGCTNFP